MEHLKMIDYNGFKTFKITMVSGIIYHVIAMTELSARIQLSGMTGELSSYIASITSTKLD